MRWSETKLHEVRHAYYTNTYRGLKWPRVEIRDMGISEGGNGIEQVGVPER